MDSDDERDIARLEIECDLHIIDRIDGPELRAFSRLEREYLLDLVNISRIPLPSALQSACSFRLPRFQKTINGFYDGELDLSGRSPARYRSVMKRFEDFKNDVLSLSYEKDVSRMELREEPDLPGQSSLESEEVPSELLLAFQEKWRIDITIYSIPELHEIIAAMSSFLTDRPCPAFQKIYLGDMPSEIIHNILRLSSTDEVINFGSTCRRHWEISRHYIYRSCTLRFRSLDPGWQGDSSEAFRILHVARDELVERIDMLASQPLIYHSIQSLQLGDSFQLDDFEAADILDEDGNVIRIDFFISVNRALLHLLSKTENIRCFSVAGWYMSMEVLDAVLSLRSNPFLDIRACRLPPGPSVQRSPDIFNAMLLIDSALAIRSWKFILGCPRLRNLTLYNASRDPSVSTFPAFSTAWANPFKTVERLTVAGFPNSDIPVLCRWLDAAKMENPQQSLRLTHLKLMAGDGGIWQIDIPTLLMSLRPSPMRCLSLNGLHYAEPDVLTAIAMSFPDLESLTLRYLQSFRQSKLKSARWPRPSWEYAEELSRFEKLKHFGWNWQSNDFEAAPSVLEFMEEGWPDDVRERAKRLRKMALWMDGRDSIPKLLAARCPTLETVCLLRGDCINWGYEIRRRVGTGDEVASAPIVVEEIRVREASRSEHRFYDLEDSCDPGSLIDYRWPLVHSPALLEERGNES